ncbi:MAG: tetratricopeptide repeat protein [Bacteroidota bacterium]
MKQLIPYFIQNQLQQGKQKGTLSAYTMFIDLSGFTPLTETLMRQGTEGAEQLSISLNNIFAPMVRLVYSKNGFIPYFAGDAFTAVFEDPESSTSPESLLETANQLRDLFTKEGLKKTRFGDFQIGIKIGLSYGDVHWGIVGEEQKAFYFRGPAIDSCAESEHHAQDQDIIMDDALLGRFKERPSVVETSSDGYYRLTESIDTEYREVPDLELPVLKRDTLTKFLPTSVLRMNASGEFRNVISIFISFKGVSDHHLFNSFATTVLEHMSSFQGYFKEVDFGDKGGVMVGFFGAPVTFENNEERALEFMSSIQEDLQDFQKESSLEFRAGITSGLAYTGIVGGDERCQYAVVGNFVNLAARLMMFADWGEILVNQEVRQRCRTFRFQHKGDIRYKGIEGDIPTYRLEGRNIEKTVSYSDRMIGRQEELKELTRFGKAIFEQEFAGLAYVFGEAGIGKSRLSFELRQRILKLGSVDWAICQSDQILQKPFNPFIYYLRNFFGQSPDKSPQKNLDQFEDRFQWFLKDCKSFEDFGRGDIYKELVRTKSILAALLGLHYEDSLWEQLDAKGRYQNTLQALDSFFKAKALLQPLVMELEDGHWFDNNSKEFLLNFIKQISAFPIFILVTSRYNDDGTKPYLIDEEQLYKNQVPKMEVDLNILSQTKLESFAEERLKGPINQEFSDLLARITNGNPFYLEQILEYLRESKLLKIREGEWYIKDKNVKLSSSISALLMARIDRLSTLVKETVKTAAVIGREFEIPVLNEVMKEHEEMVRRNGNAQAVLKEQINTAEQGQIWQSMNELRYMFRHSLLREAVYDMQLHTRLRRLHHLIAKAIEDLYADNLEERFVDLAFHFELANVTDKTNHYLAKAADHARRNFQNQQAVDFYDRLLKNLDDKENKELEIQTHLKKGRVLELIGRWDECQDTYAQALILAHQLDDRLLLGRTNNSLGNLLTLKGEYEQALPYLNKASEYFKAIDDHRGISKFNGMMGSWHFRQGGYEEAKKYFTESIRLFRILPYRSANAQIVATLGLTHMNQGNYDEGIKVLTDELGICSEANDQQALATLNTNLGIIYFEKGDYDAALECYQKGLELSEELGNLQLTAIAIGCIGSVYQRKGDYEQAMQHFIRDLELCEKIGDKQGTAITIGLIGELRSVEGEFEVAVHYLQRNLELCEELGYQKGIAKSLNTLGDIYTYTGDYKKAVRYYDDAIDISRKIDNRLVLGYSLVEKSTALILDGRPEAVEDIHLEALGIAEALGNPDLLFEAQLLAAKIYYLSGQEKAAVDQLKQLLENVRNPKESADVHYTLHSFGEGEEHRKKALSIYEDLYSREAQHIFRDRIAELSA